jgi:hypothetical protein
MIDKWPEKCEKKNLSIMCRHTTVGSWLVCQLNIDIRRKRVNVDVAYKQIINCTDAVELRNTGKFLYKIRYKRWNKISSKELELGKGE